MTTQEYHTKSCHDCHAKKPLSDFHKQGEGKHTSCCKTCENARRRVIYKKKTTDSGIRKRKYGEVNPKSGIRKLEHNRSAYVNRRCRCNLCLAASREYTEGKRKEAEANDPTVRKRAQEKSRQWYIANKQRTAERVRDYQRTETGKFVARLAHIRRKRRDRNAKGHCSREQLKARWDFYGHLCYICQQSANATDHVIALARGGSNWPANLRPICDACNSSKSAKPLSQYLLERQNRL